MNNHDPHQFRGVEQHETQTKTRVFRDDRTWGEMLYNEVVASDKAPIYFLVSIIAIFVIPGPWELYSICVFLYWRMISASQRKYPLMPNLLPYDANYSYDLRTPKPGSFRREYDKPAGDLYVGNELLSKQQGKQIWFKFANWLRHAIIFGGTGSGKSELLMTIGYNFMAAGGSFMWSDYKSSANTPHKLAWMCKRFGREDDMFIVNYIKPKIDDATKLYHQTTNTVSACSESEPAEISNTLRSLMPENESGGGSNQSFADNASALAGILPKALCELRDKGHIVLSWEIIRTYLTLPKIIELAKDNRLNHKSRQMVRMFVEQIPGVKLEEKDQDQMAYNQFGYITSYLNSGLSKLTDDYGYIYGEQFGDVSHIDVVFRGRCFASFIPSMKNTPDEVKMLGKIELVARRAALAEGLPSKLEGTAHSAKLEELYNGMMVPSLSVSDEYQEGKVKGNSISVKQGRSLGFSNIVVVQNDAGLGDEDEQQDYHENTDLKAIGRVQGSETLKKINEGLSKAWVSQSEGRSTENTMYGRREKETTSYHERDIMEQSDIKAQNPGEFHLVYEGRVIRAQALYIPSMYDSKSWEFHEQAAVILNTRIPLEPLSIQDVVAHEMASSVYKDLFNGGKQPVSNAKTGNKKFAERLGHKVVSWEDVIKAIMIDDSEGDGQWLTTEINDTGTEDQQEEHSPVATTPKEPEAAAPIETPDHTKSAVDDAIKSTTGKTAEQNDVDLLAQIISGSASLNESSAKTDSPEKEPVKEHVQLSIFEEQEQEARIKSEEIAKAKEDVSKQQPMEYISSDDGFEKAHLAATEAFMQAAIYMGAKRTDVEPEIMTAIRDIIEQRQYRNDIETRDRIIEERLRALEIDKD